VFKSGYHGVVLQYITYNHFVVYIIALASNAGDEQAASGAVVSRAADS
jgi:hypothetical protein